MAPRRRRPDIRSRASTPTPSPFGKCTGPHYPDLSVGAVWQAGFVVSNHKMTRAVGLVRSGWESISDAGKRVA